MPKKTKLKTTKINERIRECVVLEVPAADGFEDDALPEPREGWLLVRVHVEEMELFKCFQFPADRIIWDCKQQILASLPKDLKYGFNFGLYCPTDNGRAGKFLDEERRLGDYPFNGPVGFLKLKLKKRVYKINVEDRVMKSMHIKNGLRRFTELVASGNVEKIDKLCEKGFDPNFLCLESDETPLSLATTGKNPHKVITALVDGGAILDFRTRDGSTALHRAVENDSLEAVTSLLNLGASPNYRDLRGFTPLYLSVMKKTDPKICETLLHDHAVLNTHDTQGWQEIHQACRHGRVLHLEHLLFYGADMDARNASGNTSLHVCAVNNQEACTRMLLFRGADRAALNYANQTPSQVAVIAGNLELAEMIQNYKPEDVVPFRGPPRYNPRRRSGIGWGATTLLRFDGPPSPCPSEHPFSSASSSLSEGSSSNRSHEDDISIVTDKSIGDTSDIISDSSGVGTNSDSAACSIGHPSTTVVCIETYTSSTPGHLTIQAGDVIEVVGSTDCGLLEGYVRGTNRSGFFPSHIVQEVNIRQKNITNVSIACATSMVNQSTLAGPLMMNRAYQTINPNNRNTVHVLEQHHQSNAQTYNSMTAPRKKVEIQDTRTVTLHRAKRGFGFVLRGAKAASPLMQLKPSERCPGLQYLDDVDPGGVADIAGLQPGDFLLAINGEDVRCASHEHVVDLIRSSGALVTMTVASQTYPNNFQEAAAQQRMQQGLGAVVSARQCATLPRKMPLGGKLPAPAPPRRDPKTTLSVGRARAKSMVAGLEGGSGSIEKEDDESMPSTTKSNSVESIHQQSLSSTSTPGPGTPVQPRTASIKARPTSSRITAAELEELFQRQQGEIAGGNHRYSTMMCSSRFQSGNDSGTGTPPTSPHKGPIVYASVAEMKRKKNKTGTLRGKPCAIPTVSNDLKRTFHSTPDLVTALSSSITSIWANSNGIKGHHSQDDMYALNASVQRLNLPPPNHPPPPIPVSQVVKVDVSRNTTEYESTIQLQKKLQQEVGPAILDSGEIRSSFNPASNAKLYASPQDLRNVAYRTARNNVTNSNSNSINSNNSTPQIDQSRNQVRKSSSLRSSTSLNETDGITQQRATNPQYAQPLRAGTLPHPQTARPSLPQFGTLQAAPQIPDPDYSLSESDGEDENSVLLAHNTKMNEHITVPAETSGNSNASSSSGSSSIPHSFSVDEIQKMRVKLKSSKSYPNELLSQQQQQLHQNQVNGKNAAAPHAEEGDNSSSGVSSDQEVTVTHVTAATTERRITNEAPAFKSNAPVMAGTETTVKMEGILKKPISLQPLSNVTKQITSAITIDTEKKSSNNDEIDDQMDSPSPPLKGFQRHNSLTRKQAATIAMSRAIQTRGAVSLVQLPPPIEDSDDEPQQAPPPKPFVDQKQHFSRTVTTVNATCKPVYSQTQAQLQQQKARPTATGGVVVVVPPPIAYDNRNICDVSPSQENILLAPPPQFCDCTNANINRIMNQHNAAGMIAENNGMVTASANPVPPGRSVRIVGAVPKVTRLHTQ